MTWLINQIGVPIWARRGRLLWTPAHQKPESISSHSGTGEALSVPLYSQEVAKLVACEGVQHKRQYVIDTDEVPTDILHVLETGLCELCIHQAFLAAVHAAGLGCSECITEYVEITKTCFCKA